MRKGIESKLDVFVVGQVVERRGPAWKCGDKASERRCDGDKILCSHARPTYGTAAAVGTVEIEAERCIR